MKLHLGEHRKDDGVISKIKGHILDKQGFFRLLESHNDQIWLADLKTLRDFGGLLDVDQFHDEKITCWHKLVH